MKNCNEWISLAQYAEMHGISVNSVRQRVYRGSYKTAHKIGSTWVIDKNEQYINQQNINNQLKANEVTLAQYAKLHQISYDVVRRRAYRGVYKTARKIGSAWVIDKNEQDINDQKTADEVTLAQYAELHQISYNAVRQKAHRGSYKTARKIGSIWVIDKNEQHINDQKTADEVTLAQYAELHQISYDVVRQRVYRGFYKTAHKIGSIWVIDREEQDINDQITADEVTLAQYAELHQISYDAVLRRVRRGSYKTARKVGSTWVIDKNEQHQMKSNEVTLAQYAELYQISYNTVLQRIHRGFYKTARKVGSIWVIDKNEQYINQQNINNQLKANEVTLAQYAELYQISYNAVLKRIHRGFYKTTRKVGSIWVIDKNEQHQMKSNEVTLAQYAELYQISYNAVRQRIYRGSYKTARKIGSIWVIDKNEQYIGVRKKLDAVIKDTQAGEKLEGGGAPKTEKESKPATELAINEE